MKRKEITDVEVKRDDRLFDELSKNKKKKKRKIIIITVCLAAALGIAVFTGVTVLRNRIREEFVSDNGEVLSYVVETGTINTTVSGSGTLYDVDTVSVTVPSGVEIEEVIVDAYESVSEGDIIAKVDMASVMSAMADVKSELEKLDEQINEAEDDEASKSITAGASGRIKKIFAETGEEVRDVMFRNGALAVVSLDGYMAADVKAGKLSAGEAVTVRLSDGKEITGSVESASKENATILVTDNGTEYDESITVLDTDGNEVAEGKLYVHKALKVIGFTGSIREITAKENDKVKAASKLFTLDDTSYSARSYSLLRSRNEKEEALLELLKIKQNGALTASVSGSIYSIDYSEDGENIDAGEETPVVTISSDKKMSVLVSIDESDILSLDLGQEVTVYVPSVSEDAFSGTLTEINKTSSSSGTYTAEAELEKVKGMIAGMTANVSVKIEGVDDALIIPTEALHKTSDGAYVYTGYDEEAKEYSGKTEVVTGLENSSFIEIRSGLKAGDTVYYTEETSSFGDFKGFGGMGDGNGGDMPGIMPDMGKENRSDFRNSPGYRNGFPGRD